MAGPGLRGDPGGHCCPLKSWATLPGSRYQLLTPTADLLPRSRWIVPLSPRCPLRWTVPPGTSTSLFRFRGHSAQQQKSDAGLKSGHRSPRLPLTVTHQQSKHNHFCTYRIACGEVGAWGGHCGPRMCTRTDRNTHTHTHEPHTLVQTHPHMQAHVSSRTRAHAPHTPTGRPGPLYLGSARGYRALETSVSPCQDTRVSPPLSP